MPASCPATARGSVAQASASSEKPGRTSTPTRRERVGSIEGNACRGMDGGYPKTVPHLNSKRPGAKARPRREALPGAAAVEQHGGHQQAEDDDDDRQHALHAAGGPAGLGLRLVGLGVLVVLGLPHFLEVLALLFGGLALAGIHGALRVCVKNRQGARWRPALQGYDIEFRHGIHIGIVVDVVPLEAEQLQELVLVTSIVGDREEVLGGHLRPEVLAGLLDVVTQLPVVQAQATGLIGLGAAFPSPRYRRSPNRRLSCSMVPSWSP